jgi:hypothetical protein
VDLVDIFVREIMAIVGYSLLIAGVYKLFQIATELGEIKQLLRKARTVSPALSSVESPLADLHASDDASEYAAKLLRAVNAESQNPAMVPPAASEKR